MFHYGTPLLVAPAHLGSSQKARRRCLNPSRGWCARKWGVLGQPCPIPCQGTGEETDGKPPTPSHSLVALETVWRNRDRLGPPRSSKPCEGHDGSMYSRASARLDYAKCYQRQRHHLKGGPSRTDGTDASVGLATDSHGWERSLA